MTVADALISSVNFAVCLDAARSAVSQRQLSHLFLYTVSTSYGQVKSLVCYIRCCQVTQSDWKYWLTKVRLSCGDNSGLLEVFYCCSKWTMTRVITADFARGNRSLATCTLRTCVCPVIDVVVAIVFSCMALL